MTSGTVDLVIAGIGRLVTPASGPAPLRGRLLAEPIEIDGAAIAIADDQIVAVGCEADVRRSVAIGADTRIVDAGGMLAIPGFVDCHAHPVFAGDRADEFDLRNTGAGYEAIHASGGGIRRTVALTRAALDTLAGDTGQSVLARQVSRHFDWMLAAGTTTTEVKSGYGLSVETELACLNLAIDVADGHPIDVVPTVLAAHAVPPEFDDPDAYVDEVAIPAVRHAAADRLAGAADVFMERGAFDVVQTRRYLVAARDAGMSGRIHGDQFTEMGAIELGIELGVRSVDHLEATGDEGVRRLAGSSTAGVALPLSSLFLGRPFAPARSLVDAGGIVAIASDFNPGSSYGESLPLAMSLACMGCGLRAAEALSAATINAAWVLGLHDQVGRIAAGYRADVLLVDQPDVTHIAYHIGHPAITVVVKAGKVVHDATGSLPMTAPAQ